MASKHDFDCPHCGAQVPAKARACPACGSCDQTGWSEEADGGGLGLPDEEFNYEDYVRREFGPAPARPRGISRFWWIVALILLAGFVMSYVF
jgi:hypothetical protein